MFARRLKELREGKDLSQAALAKILNVAQQTVASWERGNSSPKYEILVRLSEFFNVSTDYLLGNARAESGGYYLDPDVAEMANEMKERPGLRVLFDASRHLSKESITSVKNYIEFLRKQQEGDWDD